MHRLVYQLLVGLPGKHMTLRQRQSLEAAREGINVQMVDDYAWAMLSGSSKELLQNLLAFDPAERPSAADAAKHPWLTAGDSKANHSEVGVAQILILILIPQILITRLAPRMQRRQVDAAERIEFTTVRLKRWTKTNALRKHAMVMVARSLEQHEIFGMKEAFEAMDKDRNGLVTLTTMD